MSLGSSVSFSVVASGTRPLNFQWRANQIDLPFATNSTLSLTNLQFAQAADYQVVVTNVAGSVTSLLAMGSTTEVTSMIVRLVDFFKMNNITLVMTALIKADEHLTSTNVNVSSLVDTWLALSNAEQDGVRTRTLWVVKARGMGHANQTRQLTISNKGVESEYAAPARQSA